MPVLWIEDFKYELANLVRMTGLQMPVFFLAEIKAIIDEKLYREYTTNAAPVVQKFGGQYIFRSEQLIPISGNWDLDRIILIRFPSKQILHDCFQSSEYKAIAHLRENSIISKAILIEE